MRDSPEQRIERRCQVILDMTSDIISIRTHALTKEEERKIRKLAIDAHHLTKEIIALLDRCERPEQHI